MKTDVKIKALFTDEPSNTGRQPELDLMRTILILDLVLCHCYLTCCTEERLTHGFAYFVDTIWGGPLAAPGFMVVMGMGMLYTGHFSSRDFARRGIKLGLLGILLNICRCTVPYLIGYAITGDYGKYMTDIVFETFENDILMFAGLSFLLMALLRHLKLSPWVIFAIGIIMSCIATAFNGTDLHSDAANIIVGHFFGTEDPDGLVRSYFTLFNWFAIPAFGYLYGHYYIRLTDKKTFHLLTGIPSALLGAAYLTVGIISRAGVFGDGELCYYHAGIYDIAGIIVCTTACISLTYWISLILPESFMRVSEKASRNITVIYFIQWVIIRVMGDVVLYILTGSSELSDLQIVLCVPVIIAVTVALAGCYNKMKTKVIHSNA